MSLSSVSLRRKLFQNCNKWHNGFRYLAYAMSHKTSSVSYCKSEIALTMGYIHVTMSVMIHKN